MERPLPDNGVSTAELAYRLAEFRKDTAQSMHALRNDMSVAITKLDMSLDEIAQSMSKSYVNLQLWEEVRRNQGERIGMLEQRMAHIEEKSAARYEAMQVRVTSMDKEIHKKFDEKDKEAKRDRNLVQTALVFPFLMLIIGLMVNEVFIK
jgi:hypothetical protein